MSEILALVGVEGGADVGGATTAVGETAVGEGLEGHGDALAEDLLLGVED